MRLDNGHGSIWSIQQNRNEEVEKQTTSKALINMDMSFQLDDNHSAFEEEPVGTLPNELELTLLCLDYLRDLRRSYPPKALRKVEGIDADYLTMACWALNRAIVFPKHLTAQEGNDAWFDKNKANVTISPFSLKETFKPRFPSVSEMEKEFLYQGKENAGDEESKDDATDSCNPYEYDDLHPSNSHRFYPLAGLASGPALRGALSLGEVTAAGLAGLGARSRLQAERDMIQSQLFEQFLEAVQAKGFFEDTENEGPSGDPEEDKIREEQRRLLYEERYRKVVGKFRTKLCTKADALSTGDLTAFTVAEQQRRSRELRIQYAIEQQNNPGEVKNTSTNFDFNAPHRGATPSAYLQQTELSSRLLQERNNTMTTEDRESVASNPVVSMQNPIDLEEAEKLKTQGNSHMQKKEYQQAAECYTQALKLSPAGPHSHVYFSNRAAALVSMKKFSDAVSDSERSLALKPDYGKAHARLGLAHFLLGNYRQAMEAYTVALKYEPDNKSSKNYLEKAAKRLAESGDSQVKTQSSFSVVSEWDKANHKSKEDRRKEDRHSIGETRENDEREAEKYKVRGNSLMSNRDYAAALDAYTKAIELCPSGSQSHVYYSNRAAALCYLEKYEEAENDSLKSLNLYPTYGKAHARLGLSRFFLRDYQGAIDAYTKALEHDPDNAASKSYLAKARSRLESSLSRTRSSDPLSRTRSSDRRLDAGSVTSQEV